jgi:hypothetical protein
MGSILTCLTERTAAIIASRAAAAPIPFHRPPSGHWMQQQKLASSSSRPTSSSSSMARTMSPSRGTWGSPGSHQCHQQQEQLEEACGRPQSAYSTVSIYQHQQQQSPLRQRPQSAFPTGPTQQGGDSWGMHTDHHHQQQQPQQQSSRLGSSSSRSRTVSPSRPATATLSRAAAATAVFSDSEGEEEEVEMVDCSRLDTGTAAAAEEVTRGAHAEGVAVDAATTTRTGGSTARSPRPRSSRPPGQQLTVTLAPDVTDASDAWGVSDTASPKDVTRTLLAGGLTSQQQQQQQRELVQEVSLASVWGGAGGGSKSNRKGRAQAMELLCDRLMAENAFLLAELSKWEGGWHSCQVYGTGASSGHPAAAAATGGTLQQPFATTKSTTAGPGATLNASLAQSGGGGGGEGQALPQQQHPGLTLSRPCSAASTTTKRPPPTVPSRALATGESAPTPVPPPACPHHGPSMSPIVAHWQERPAPPCSVQAVHQRVVRTPVMFIPSYSAYKQTWWHHL